MKSGIYIITCLVNRKYYIGYATDFKRRKNHHFNRLKANKHCNIYLQNAYNKYGKENFVFEILEEYPNEGFILPSMEHYWYNLLDAHNPIYGYNLKPTNPYNKSSQTRDVIARAALSKKGFKHSEESKKRMSESRKGKKINRIKPVWNKGVKMSKQFGEKISKIRLKKFSNRPILIMDKNYNILKKVNNTKEVLEFFKIDKNSSISECLNNSKYSIYGHYLMYEEDFLKGKKIIRKKQGNECYLVNSENMLNEKEFQTLTDCANYLGISIQALVYRVKHKTIKNNYLVILKKDYDNTKK